MYINMYMYMCMYIPLICIHLYPTGTTVIHMDMGPPLEHNQPTSGHNPIPKWMFLPVPPSITNSSLARGMASWAPPWFMLKFWQTWFCAGQMQSRLLWGHGCNNHCMPQRQTFQDSLPPLALTFFLPHLQLPPHTGWDLCLVLLA